MRSKNLAVILHRLTEGSRTHKRSVELGTCPLVRKLTIKPSSSLHAIKLPIHWESLYFQDCLIWLYFSMGNKLSKTPREMQILPKEGIQRAAEKKRKKWGERWNSRSQRTDGFSSSKATQKKYMKSEIPQGREKMWNLQKSQESRRYTVSNPCCFFSCPSRVKELANIAQ